MFVADVITAPALTPLLAAARQAGCKTQTGGGMFDAVARLMGSQADYGIRVGARADFLFTDAEDAAGLVAGGALKRSVMLAGSMIAGEHCRASD